MPLREIPLTLTDSASSSEVLALIEEANRRADKFYDAGLGLRYPKYIPSDPLVVDAAIASLQRDGHLCGGVFCEWGCGFAIASGIAALRGFEAYGIEIEEELFSRATELMHDLGIVVELLLIDYLPDGFDESEGVGGKDLIAPEERTTPNDSLSAPEYDGLDPGEVDLFFVYPWPDQDEMMKDLFAAVASDGAILLMYEGEGEISAYLKDEDEYGDDEIA